MDYSIQSTRVIDLINVFGNGKKQTLPYFFEVKNKFACDIVYLWLSLLVLAEPF